MRTEAEIRQSIDWLEKSIAFYPSDIPEKDFRYVIGALRGQIDILLWVLGEPTKWDTIHEAMKLRYTPPQS